MQRPCSDAGISALVGQPLPIWDFEMPCVSPQERHIQHSNVHRESLQVKGKVNALSVDSCQRLGVLFEDLVASCELVNSSRVQVQVTGVVPTIAIDKCDGVQVCVGLSSVSRFTGPLSLTLITVHALIEDGDP